MLSSLYDNIHPPEIEINPPKMACGGLGSGIINKRNEKEKEFKKEEKKVRHAILSPYKMRPSM